ncbi:MAG: conjugal transfer protein TraR [Candidatus Nealsonbacteria bacterium CG11_big_fil_rev_8_21_14_0_20_39_9]|uniref:Conjugal transfer protein TraR n=1 Tax=Candidatus Nealsonbacteria bacterium CG11_big_fil_rev_8_21_14_0_20_39_9 TaxID=1974715 RepID=A0A2H0MPI2_9BACT|nr:MAG: conjugal transfer protein TraR [Candidatus Nealsonbacteria bacterium CG11_big_fil_rev_8_21_14_0_20_39_9]
MLIFWILIFILSLALLVKSADWLVESSEKIALVLKISPFIVGVTIVAIGTSMPELAAAFASTLKGATEIVVSTVIGANVHNIFLVIGLAAILARRLTIKRSLVDLDLSLLAISTAIFLFVAFDGEITWRDGLLLLIAFLIYLAYTIVERKGEKGEVEGIVEIIPGSVEQLNFKVFLFLILGIIGLGIGAKYTVESTLQLAHLLKLVPSVIAFVGIAFGTSLPELIVSIRAAWKKKYEIALGNIFGSNVFNILIVTGLPAFVTTVKIDQITLTIGFPFLIAATLLFVISGISGRIHIWEGSLYVLAYIVCCLKFLGLF